VPDLIAFVLLLAITAYSTAGGVDFGAGIWDLMAGNSPRGREARALIDHAMAPVWEVNNVWLVLAIVLTWTGFPILFQQVFSSLYPLFTFALLGLVLRGAFFAFRHVAEEPRAHRIADVVFGLSSLLTPFFFAASLGAIASGHLVPFSPMSVSFGLVSLAATADSGLNGPRCPDAMRPSEAAKETGVSRDERPKTTSARRWAGGTAAMRRKR